MSDYEVMDLNGVILTSSGQYCYIDMETCWQVTDLYLWDLCAAPSSRPLSRLAAVISMCKHRSPLISTSPELRLIDSNIYLQDISQIEWEIFPMCKVYIEAKVICQSQLGRGHGDSAAHWHPHSAHRAWHPESIWRWQQDARCVSLTVSGDTRWA